MNDGNNLNLNRKYSYSFTVPKNFIYNGIKYFGYVRGQTISLIWLPFWERKESFCLAFMISSLWFQKVTSAIETKTDRARTGHYHLLMTKVMESYAHSTIYKDTKLHDYEQNLEKLPVILGTHGSAKVY